MASTMRIAAAQASPVYLDREKTIHKVCGLIMEASSKSAKLIVFPEAFVPGYPDWTWVVPNYRGDVLNNLYSKLLENSVSVDRGRLDTICRAAKSGKIWVVLGVHERNSEASDKSLYNSVVMIDDNGFICHVHRKLIPTGGERMVWGQGQGDDLKVVSSSFASIGSLICWENYMPLARQALYNQGMEILAAPTWDKSDNWIQSMQHIAREGGTYVISSCMALRMDDIPDAMGFREFYPGDREWINTGRSCIISPKGKILAGPIEEKEEIIYADFDPEEIASAKRLFDAAGHYSRPDVFKFAVNVDQEKDPKPDLG